MLQIWRPTLSGTLLTSLFSPSKNWSLTLDGGTYKLEVAGRVHQGSVLETESFVAVPGVLWTLIKIPTSTREPLLLDGISNSAARAMMKALAETRSLRRQEVERLLRSFDSSIRPLVAWCETFRTACKHQLRSKGWLTNEFAAEQTCNKPTDLKELLSEPAVIEHLKGQSEYVQEAVRNWARDVYEVAESINQRHLCSELQNSRSFLDRVEKSPLTPEQAEAVICFDNRVLLVASAGSGKTSTMVAKAGYALHKGYFSPERILLLAFNNAAAAELRERVNARLEPLGLPANRVVARTFHAFGLDVIGAATGKRPSLAPWVENGLDVETLLTLVDDLKDGDANFRAQWDLFRLVLGQDLPKFGKESEYPDTWDKRSGKRGFWTLNNDVVKSRGEQLIANWLFYNGVEYAYEADYKFPTADAEHRQYCPDFYLPKIDAYLEHWALDEHGLAPPEFTGYEEGIRWKRSVHEKNGTTLLETTMGDLWRGRAFQYLTDELTKRGIVLDPNPDRPVPGRQPMENPRLARTFRTFLTHAKSNRLSDEELRRRLDAEVAGQFKYRHSIFLSLFEKIREAWTRKLESAHCIDFEDMLNLATDCIEKGQWHSPFELVMVDEFQDASQARARLIAGLVNAPGRCLFAVGDDWQSINRFAGADLCGMTDFEAKFGPARVLRLETTFRCPQSLCDISSEFVQKNPRQMRKEVSSAKPDVPEPVRIIRVDRESGISSAVRNRIGEIAEQAAAAGTEPATVYVLGRYNHDRSYLPVSRAADRNVRVEFTTVHAAKGLEADHVILPRVTSESLGFPSRVADDPVLQLAMPDGDDYENAEERRLFYVALTRARASVTLITVEGKESPFIVELVKEHGLSIQSLDGTTESTEVCPKCHEGLMVLKHGKNGPFYGCNRFPRCRQTRNPRGHETAHQPRAGRRTYSDARFG